MSKVIISEVVNPKFGKCISLTNGLIDLQVTLEFGPRVIHCSCAGKENLFFEDESKGTLGEQFDGFDDQLRLYGGHRLWISPEVLPRCYHPDNQPVSVDYDVENGARFTAAVEVHNQIQKSITVSLDPDAPRVNVVHSVRNTGMWDIQFAPWAITMLAAGGTEVMPMPNRGTGLLPNRNFSFWDYTDLTDPRIYFGKDYLSLKQDPAAQTAFKLGYNNEAGWAAYFNKGQVFLKYFEPMIDAFYPDNGCCFETYTNGKMLEVETLGEMVELGPDDFVTLEEEWELYEAEAPVDYKNEDQLKKAVERWI